MKQKKAFFFCQKKKKTLSALKLPQSTTSPQLGPNAIDATFMHPHHTIPATGMDSKLTNYGRYSGLTGQGLWPSSKISRYIFVHLWFGKQRSRYCGKNNSTIHSELLVT